MNVSGQFRLRLYKALLTAFPTIGELERMVDFGLGEKLSNISKDGTLQDVVYGLILWADAHEKIEDLARAAKDANSNSQLTDLVREIDSSIANHFLYMKETLINATVMPEKLDFELFSDVIERSETPYFIAGPPITDPIRFFGREREIKRIFNLLKMRPLQNAAIIGPKRSGKTSLLKYLQRINATRANQLRPGQRNDWLSNAGQYRWIFVDFQDPRWKNRDSLLRYLLQCVELSTPNNCDLDRFMEVLSQGLKHPTVVLLDEVDVALERYSELDTSFWEGLRALAATQVQGNLAFILASHESPDQIARHSGKGSPFFNTFGYACMLGPLTDAEAESLLTSSPIPFPDADVQWIMEHSGRWPLLLQILARERLLTLEDGIQDSSWREEGLNQVKLFAWTASS